MLALKVTLVLCHLSLVLSQGPTTTPVPILKQINKQNDDGSYSYGYEAADGSFKIETKYPSGDVAGKYGYVDESGNLREISYGASSKRGFEPQGAGIVVPPPSLHEPTSNALSDGQEDDGQYREDPKIYEDPKYNSRQTKSKSNLNFRQYQQPSFTQNIQPAQPQNYQPTNYQQPNYQQANYQPSNYQVSYQQPAYQRQTTAPVQNQNSIFNQFPQQFPSQERPLTQAYHQQPQFSFQSYQPQYQAPSYSQYQSPSANQYNPNQNFNPFFGHPAQNFDPSTGSYSINFTG